MGHYFFNILTIFSIFLNCTHVDYECKKLNTRTNDGVNKCSVIEINYAHVRTVKTLVQVIGVIFRAVFNMILSKMVLEDLPRRLLETLKMHAS